VVTFDEARALVELEMRERWAPERGTLFVAPWGREDATSWLVVAGAREALVDNDLSFEWTDAPLVLVDKDSGAISYETVITSMARLRGMSDVGPWPAE
jgi:hypothetical protein